MVRPETKFHAFPEKKTDNFLLTLPVYMIKQLDKLETILHYSEEKKL